jgi:hypothetical protein
VNQGQIRITQKRLAWKFGCIFGSGEFGVGRALSFNLMTETVLSIYCIIFIFIILFHSKEIIMHGGVFVLETEESLFHYLLLFNAS